MKKLLISGGVLAALALAGCETGPPLSAAQCEVADWRALGFRDGSEGRAPERFVALEQACAAAGLGSDRGAYFAGRDEGLLGYCQPARAFQLGLAGNSYACVCPAELDSVFRFAHGDGRRIHDARAALSSAESTISSLRSELDDVESKLEANRLGYERSQTDSERDRHRSEIDRLRRERREIENRLYDAERDRRYRLTEFDDVRDRIGFQYGPW